MNSTYLQQLKIEMKKNDGYVGTVNNRSQEGIFGSRAMT